jgi:hypothetical protein
VTLKKIVLGSTLLLTVTIVVALMVSSQPETEVIDNDNTQKIIFNKVNLESAYNHTHFIIGNNQGVTVYNVTIFVEGRDLVWNSEKQKYEAVRTQWIKQLIDKLDVNQSILMSWMELREKYPDFEGFSSMKGYGWVEAN